MKRDPHILVSESPLREREDYTALCGAELKKAAWIRTDGDIRNRAEWNSALNSACRKCSESYSRRMDGSATVRIYFAVDEKYAVKNEVQEWI